MIRFKRLSHKISWVTLVLFMAMIILTGMPAQPAYASSVGGITITADKEFSSLTVGSEFTVNIALQNATIKGLDIGIEWDTDTLQYKSRAPQTPIDEWAVFTNAGTNTANGIICFAGATASEVALTANNVIYSITFVVKKQGASYVRLFATNSQKLEIPESVGFIYTGPTDEDVFMVPESKITNNLQTFTIGESDTTPPAFVTDYPADGTIEANGSKKVNVIVNSNEDAQLYAMVSTNIADPDPVDIKDEVADTDCLLYDNFALTANTPYTWNIDLSGVGGADGTSYYVHMFLEDAAENQGTLVTHVITTPPAPAPAVTGVAIKTQPTQLSYVEGQDLDLTGLEVTLTYDNNTTEDVIPANFAAKGITTSPAAGTALTIADHNNQPVVVSCNGKTANTNNLTVEAKAVTAVTIKTQPTKLSYIEGQTLDLTGLEVTLTYNDSTTEDVVLADFAAKGITASPTAGTALTIADHNGKAIEVSCNGQTANTNNLTVEAKAIINIKVISGVTAPVRGATPVTTITETEQFTGTVTWDPAIAAGGKFAANTVYYAQINITPKTGWTLEGLANNFFTVADAEEMIYDISNPGSFEAKFPKTAAASGGGGGGVVTPTVTGVAIKAAPDKVAYTEGDALDLSGLIVTLTYSNGTTKDIALANFADNKITVSPKAGDVLDAGDKEIVITVNGKTVKQAITVNKKETVPPPVEETVLTDIDGHWAQANIEYLVGIGAVAGYPDETFRPDSLITRAEFAKIIVDAFELTAESGKIFADTADHWAKDYVAIAAANGIVLGYNDQEFGPDDLITREQMAIMIVKAAGLTEATGELSFTDKDEVSSWAYDWVVSATQNKIMSGYTDNTFKPLNNATRAEAATVIYNVLMK